MRGETSVDVVVEWEKNLPADNFFYHTTLLDCLESIKRIGLTTPKMHGMGKRYDVPFYPKTVTDRLFLWSTEKEGLEYTAFYTRDDEPMLSLRFRREVVKGRLLYNDLLGYPGRRVRLDSVYLKDGSIPPSEIQACEHVTWNNRLKRYYTPRWIPLSKVVGPTVKV